MDLRKNNAMYAEMRKIISSKNIKGIVIGYPLDIDGNSTLHCNFIERWIQHMWSLGIGRNVPVTLVNEYGSSLEAKVKIAEKI